MTLSASSPGRLPLAADAARPHQAAADPGVVLWLVFVAAMIFFMAVIGAITRLTESGLSIVEWQPLSGTVPPLSAQAWQDAFDAYRQTPEFHLKNAGMTLEGFRQIYFWEWLHRLWGRMIGVAFALPLAWFWLRGRLDRRIRPALLGLLALGFAQGALGWFMVESGLVDRPSVSHYRLAAHLALAVLVYALVVRLGLRLTLPPPAAAPPGLRRHAWLALALIAITMVWGAFVAGLDAGFVYNTFPLMDGQVLPPEAWSIRPAWLNIFQNTALVQFTHRWLAIGTALVVLALAGRVLAARIAGPARRFAWALGAMVLVQVALGISTLLLVVPLALGAAHQAGAILVLTLLIAVEAALGGRDRAEGP